MKKEGVSYELYEGKDEYENLRKNNGTIGLVLI
jgi:hypothetical protein